MEIERSEPKLFTGDEHISIQFSQFLATFVDIRWKIVSFMNGNNKAMMITFTLEYAVFLNLTHSFHKVD